MTGQAAHHYLIFETAGGFCGIAWNSPGITRFQLPTKSATATERILLRQMPGAKPGAPAPEVAEASTAQEPKVCRLTAGGNWIRNFSSALPLVVSRVSEIRDPGRGSSRSAPACVR